jgi:hypothetical protein
VVIGLEALAALVRHAEQQRRLVPGGDGRRDAGGHADGAAEGPLDGRVAADVVGVRMGVEEAGQPPPARASAAAPRSARRG